MHDVNNRENYLRNFLVILKRCLLFSKCGGLGGNMSSDYILLLGQVVPQIVSPPCLTLLGQPSSNLYRLFYSKFCGTVGNQISYLRLKALLILINLPFQPSRNPSTSTSAETMPIYLQTSCLPLPSPTTAALPFI